MNKKIASFLLTITMLITGMVSPVSADVDSSSAAKSTSASDLASTYSVAKSYHEVHDLIHTEWSKKGIIKAPPKVLAPCAKCGKHIRKGDKYYMRDNIYTCSDCGPRKVIAKCHICKKSIYEFDKFHTAYEYEDSRKITITKGYLTCDSCGVYKAKEPPKYKAPPSVIDSEDEPEPEISDEDESFLESEDAIDDDFADEDLDFEDDGSDYIEGDDFSTTNVQVDGIEEGDIVKTDGKYIYLASEKNSAVYVIRAVNGKMKIRATYKKENAKPIELLLYNGKITIIWEKVEYKKLHMHTKSCYTYNCYNAFEKEYSSGYRCTYADGKYFNLPTYLYNYYYYDDYDYPDEEYYEEWDDFIDDWDNPSTLRSDDYRKNNWDYQFETVVDVYEVEKFAEKKSTYTQKGFYIASRMVGSNIYLTTTYDPNLTEYFEAKNTSRFIPTYQVNGKTKLVKATEIIVPEAINTISYTIAGGLDVNSSNLFVSNRMILGGAETIYTSKSYIYIAGTTYDRKTYATYSDIAKFAYSKGKIRAIAVGQVEGTILNQMNMDEHNGYLRVATHVQRGGMETNLTILDKNLNFTSRIKGIGKNEKMRSSRFMGDTAYIVTFMLTDPLYSFDLSNPKKPKILDELKIPGYSSYMHKWDKESLLGVGFDANENNGQVIGVKVSMFDVLDNSNLSERHVARINLNKLGSSHWNILSPIKDEHRAVIVSKNRNLIAFPFSYYDKYKKSYIDRLVLLSYTKEKGFKLIGELKSVGSSGVMGFERGVYIGNYIYAIGQQKIVSAKISKFELIEELKLS